MTIRPILVRRVIPALFIATLVALPFSVVTDSPKMMIGLIATIILLSVAHEFLEDDGSGPAPWPWL